ncbi:ATP-binding protein [Phreatobacter oligotrophus]|uniref:histidine kinase n=1 Tax=Phreatobacter oligotrophus TaxID=1122261 RepID=A0A2T4YS16_9HYPH|nr:ATP-binding protein [Phreatobacter oligotrophus]PTM46317.1 signal transduction histidine kinase [Phreatobacter oligotrophus]
MTRSIRVRFAWAAVVAIAVALVIAGVAVSLIFESTLRSRAAAEIGDDLAALARSVTTGPDGRLKVDIVLSDRRFTLPLSGFYWQVGRTDVEVASTSLGAFRFPFRARLPAPEEVVVYEREGPQGRGIMVFERLATNPVAGGEPVRVAVGLDHSELDEARRQFTLYAAAALAVLGLALLATLWLANGVTLAPLSALRDALNRVHRGERDRIDGDFPEEVQPLVDDLNTLLSTRDADLDAARARAGDLAHGLKTPLAVLSTLARRLRGEGQTAIADEIDIEVVRMSQHVSRELMRARANIRAFRRTKATPVRPIVDSLVNALAVLSEGRTIAYAVDMPDDLQVAMDETDLMEVLGNVMDNARKWTQGQVLVEGRAVNGSATIISIEDDGPGLPDIDTFTIERGRRLDERIDGHGLGLAIVRDLVEVYGGDVTFARSRFGGLKVELALAGGGRSREG